MRFISHPFCLLVLLAKQLVFRAALHLVLPNASALQKSLNLNTTNTYNIATFQCAALCAFFNTLQTIAISAETKNNKC
jgi:hypothetical protein